MAFSTKAEFDAIRQITFGSLIYSYQAFGSALTKAARIIRFVNSTNSDVFLSDDGTTNQIRLAAGSFLLLDLTTNQVQESGLFIAVGTQFYVKVNASSALPTMGAVWIEVIYATES